MSVIQDSCEIYIKQTMKNAGLYFTYLQVSNSLGKVDKEMFSEEFLVDLKASCKCFSGRDFET